jgi:hypothetical protein
MARSSLWPVQTSNRSLIRHVHVYGMFKLATGPLFHMFMAYSNWQWVPYSTCLWHIQTGNRSLFRHVYGMFKLAIVAYDMFRPQTSNNKTFMFPKIINSQLLVIHNSQLLGSSPLVLTRWLFSSFFLAMRIPCLIQKKKNTCTHIPQNVGT